MKRALSKKAGYEKSPIKKAGYEKSPIKLQ